MSKTPARTTEAQRVRAGELIAKLDAVFEEVLVFRDEYPDARLKNGLEQTKWLLRALHFTRGDPDVEIVFRGERRVERNQSIWPTAHAETAARGLFEAGKIAEVTPEAFLAWGAKQREPAPRLTPAEREQRRQEQARARAIERNAQLDAQWAAEDAAAAKKAKLNGNG